MMSDNGKKRQNSVHHQMNNRPPGIPPGSTTLHTMHTKESKQPRDE